MNYFTQVTLKIIPYFHYNHKSSVYKIKKSTSMALSSLSISEYVISRTINIRKNNYSSENESDMAHAIASVNQKYSWRTQIKSKFDGTFIRLGARRLLYLLSFRKQVLFLSRNCCLTRKLSPNRFLFQLHSERFENSSYLK